MELLLKDVRTFLFARSRQFLEDIIDIASGPKTFLRGASEYTTENLARAFSFFLILYVLVNLLFVYLIPKDFDTRAFLAFSVAYTVLFFAAALAVLQLSWLIVGARPPLRRVMLCFLYFSGIAMLIQAVLFIGVAMAMHPFDEIVPLMDEYNTLAYEDPYAADAFMTDNPTLALRVVGLVGAFLLYFVLDVAWVIVIWGAFRELAGTGRFRSAIAMTVYYVLATIVFLLSLSFAEVLMPGASAPLA